MALPKGICRHCGAELLNMKMHAELALVDPATGDVAGTQRNFLGECPQHGPMFADHKMGHHSTLGEAKLKRRYSKRERRLISRLLNRGEAKAFAKSLIGKRSYSPEDIKRWDALSVGARLTKFDERVAALNK